MKKMFTAVVVATILMSGCATVASSACMMGCGFIPDGGVAETTGKAVCEAFCKSQIVAKADQTAEQWLNDFEAWLKDKGINLAASAKMAAKAQLLKKVSK